MTIHSQKSALIQPRTSLGKSLAVVARSIVGAEFRISGGGGGGGSWREPADGVPLSGEEADAACQVEGRRLCPYLRG